MEEVLAHLRFYVLANLNVGWPVTLCLARMGKFNRKREDE